MTLTEWRKSRGLSFRAAGEILGVSHVRVIQYERGEHSLRLRTVDQIERKTGGAVTRLDWPKEGGMKPICEQEWHMCDLDSRIVENADDLVIADIRVPPHDGGGDVPRLISAAPDMARALLAALEWDKRSRDCPEAAGRHPNEQMRAALRKAGVISTQLPAAPDDNQP